MAAYSYRDHIISVVPCSKEDIPSHIERVLSYWESTGTNIDYQKTLLEACVDAGTAFKIIDENNKCYSCGYWKPIENSDDYLVHYFWFKNGIILGIVLDYVYKYTTCKHVQYVPHQKQRISYASFLTRNNIISFYSNSPVMVVNVRNPKLIKVYEKYFLNNKDIHEV